MNTSGEAADQVMRMMLEGTEVLIKLSGKGAKETAVFLYSVFRQQKKTKGAARLSSMLRSGKPLKVLTFKSNNLAKFKEVAKQYGVLYSVLRDKDNTGGVFDVLVRADDESKINRIIDRFGLVKVDGASIKAEIIKEKAEKEQTDKEAETNVEEQNVSEKDIPEKADEDKMFDDLFNTPKEAEVKTQGNPDMARSEKSASDDIPKLRENGTLSEPSLTDFQSRTDMSDGMIDKNGKKRNSVKAELEKYKKERQAKINEARGLEKAPAVKDNEKAR